LDSSAGEVSKTSIDELIERYLQARFNSEDETDDYEYPTNFSNNGRESRSRKMLRYMFPNANNPEDLEEELEHILSK
jgi:hypothetical protein